MKITKEVEIGLQLKAILNDSGELKMSLTATAPYGERTASASLTDFPAKTREAVSKALGAVLNEYAKQAAGLAENAAAEARVAAVRMNEEV